MQVWLVGGAVRDLLSGREPGDRDWVVVGETHESMVAAGFRTVGADFPVYLHPETGEEYALARTERKSGRGHLGFVTETSGVPLVDDLRRRDLTINAMAIREDHLTAPRLKDVVFDPFGGRADLDAGVLRHVSVAFAEDPLRVLRVARFAAQTDFTIAPETVKLGRLIASWGDLAELTPERVAREFLKALAAPRPSRFLEVLRAMDALAAVLPEAAALRGQTQDPRHHAEGDAYAHTLLVLDAMAARRPGDALAAFAAFAHDLGKGLTPVAELPRHHGHDKAGGPVVQALAERLKLPSVYARIGVKSALWHMLIHKAPILNPRTFVRLYDANGAQRRADLDILADVAITDAIGRRTEEPALAREEEAQAAVDLFLKVMDAIGVVRLRDLVSPETLETMPPQRRRDALHEGKIHAARSAYFAPKPVIWPDMRVDAAGSSPSM